MHTYTPTLTHARTHTYAHTRTHTPFSKLQSCPPNIFRTVLEAKLPVPSQEPINLAQRLMAITLDIRDQFDDVGGPELVMQLHKQYPQDLTLQVCVCVCLCV